jgi:hypothetical protein
MTRADVLAIMGPSRTFQCQVVLQDRCFLFGWPPARATARSRIVRWTGWGEPGISEDEWPVRVRLDNRRRVCRIARGNHVEDSPHRRDQSPPVDSAADRR